MTTDNISIPTKEDMMAAAKLTYRPIYGMLTQVKHDAVIENLNKAVVAGDPNDIVAKVINAQDTERVAHKARKETKIFKKEFKGGQYKESNWQKNSALPDLNDRILNQYMRQLDFEIFNGVDNNGLISSNDPSFIQNAASALPATISGNNGIDALMTAVTNLSIQVDDTCGSNKIGIGIYGKELRKYLNKVTANGDSYSAIMCGNFPQFGFFDVPSNLVKTGNGLILIATDLVALDYTLLPSITKVGLNEENEYLWINYAYGTANVDVKTRGALVHQPVSIG